MRPCAKTRHRANRAAIHEGLRDHQDMLAANYQEYLADRALIEEFEEPLWDLFAVLFEEDDDPLVVAREEYVVGHDDSYPDPYDAYGTL